MSIQVEFVGLEDDSLDAVFRSAVYRFRAQARGYEKSALADMNEAIRLNPSEGAVFSHRAFFWKHNNDSARYAADIQRSEELNAAAVANQRAWTLATSANAAARDGKEACKLATRACQMTGYGVEMYVDTLAAAYAEAGDFDHAIEWESKALKMAPESEQPAIRKLLSLYETKKPFRDKQ